jgi:hypothetical protein
MTALYLFIIILLGQEVIIEPDKIGESTIPNSVEINEFLTKNKFKTKLLEEEETMMEFYFAHGFNSCWGDCWRNCAWVDTLFSSSELSPTNNISYDVKNIDDFDLRTAWIEGKPDYGIGESISVNLKTIEYEEVKIKNIVVVNGYTKNHNVWKNNSRIKKLRLSCNGKIIGTLSLKDTDKYQSFDIADLVTKENNQYLFKFEIVDIYPGDKFSDTGISAILFEGDGCG